MMRTVKIEYRGPTARPEKQPSTSQSSDAKGSGRSRVAPRLKHRALPPVKERASFRTKLSRLKEALVAWNKAGRPITSKAGRKLRRATCDGCPYFNAAGNLGLGECQAPGCGCTRGKLWLATSSCPLGKWPAEVVHGRPIAHVRLQEL